MAADALSLHAMAAEGFTLRRSSVEEVEASAALGLASASNAGQVTTGLRQRAGAPSGSTSRRPDWTGPEALSKRLPGQPLPPDPFLEQANAADITYGWHSASETESDGEPPERPDFYQQIADRRQRWRDDWLRRRTEEDDSQGGSASEQEQEPAAPARGPPRVLTGTDVPQGAAYAGVKTVFPPGFGSALRPPDAADGGEGNGGEPPRPVFPRAHTSFFSSSAASWNRHPVLGFVPTSWSVDDLERLRALLREHQQHEWRISTSGEVTAHAPAADHADAPRPATAESARREREEDDFLREQQQQVICRICFEGPGSRTDEGKSLGRLLSPCRCKGTMKFIHSSCLDSWRRFSSRSSSAVACDQCGAPYRFRKSRFVGMANSRALLALLSVTLFTTLIWSVGFGAATAIERWGVFDDDVRSVVTGAPPTRRRARSWDAFAAEDDLYDYSWSGGWGHSYSDAAGWYSLLKSAVRSIVSGESTQAVKQVVLGDDQEEGGVADRDEQDDRGWWSAVVHDWKYGPQGFWPGQDPAAVDPAAAPPPERYDARKAQPSGRPRRSTRRRRRPAWVQRLLLQFSLGFSLVGMLSFINLIFGLSFFGPFHLNLGMGRGLARMTRRRGGRAGGGTGGDASAVTSLILLALVLIGVVRALVIVYRLVHALARRMLARAEDYIVDWAGEDESAELNQGAPSAADTGAQAVLM